MDRATAKAFTRDDTLFSLCGLNCSLCPMFVRGDCTEREFCESFFA